MSRPVGRHRAPRQTGVRALRRPAVAATAAISAVSVSAAGYATASSAIAAPQAADAPRQNAAATPAADAVVGAADAAVAADASAQSHAVSQAVAARAASVRGQDARLAKVRAAAAHKRHQAQAAAKAKHKAVERAHEKAQEKAKEKAKERARQKAKARKAEQAQETAQDSRDTGGTSRSASRPPVQQSTGGSPQAIAASMLSSFGWSQGQMGCLTALWNKESGWNVYATNPSSGAYGIPQALPGGKMASAGADWRTNPATQIRWGLGYIRSTYGSPCGAWGHSQATGWY